MNLRGLCFYLVAVCSAFPQTSRIATDIDPKSTAVLRGNVAWQTKAAEDLGRTDARRSLRHIVVHFGPSAGQQAELDKLSATVGGANTQSGVVISLQ